MWVNLARLLTLLRQRRIDLRGIIVFVDDNLVDPRYRRPPAGNSTPEEVDEGCDDDGEED